MRAWKAVVLSGILAVTATPVTAQGRIEVGTQAGFTYRSSDELQNEPTLFQFGIPGGGLLGRPTVWATIFVARQIAFEPHFSYQFVRDDDRDENVGTVAASARGVWYSSDPRRGSFYAFGDASIDRSRELQTGADVTDSDFGVGGGAGYRWPLGDRVGIRWEGLYRFWVDDRRSELAVTVGFGVVAKRR
ncbi:MAG: outer membrane beta-barrel protein [Gemmatimonadota bacterium]